MSLFNRVKNIIKSNIYFKNEPPEDIDLNQYDDIYYDDAKEMPKTDNKEAKYYAVLELEYGAGFKEIKAAYKKLLRKYHHDLYHNNPEKLKTAQKVTEQINEAYTYFERKYLWVYLADYSKLSSQDFTLLYQSLKTRLSCWNKAFAT